MIRKGERVVTLALFIRSVTPPASKDAKAKVAAASVPFAAGARI